MGWWNLRLCKDSLLVCGILCAVGLASCIGPAPAMRDERTAVVSGRDTTGLSTAGAIRKALLQAARITVDHGFRYFKIVEPRGQDETYAHSAMALRLGSSWAADGVSLIRPGADVTIKVFRSGEMAATAAGIWDAEYLLTSGVPDRALRIENPAATQLQVPSPPGTQGLPGARAPRCTIYGCDW